MLTKYKKILSINKINVTLQNNDRDSELYTKTIIHTFIAQYNSQ